MKKTLYIIGGLVLALGLATSCSEDLDISSIDPQSSPAPDDISLLAKAYSTLGLTGQQGPSGSGDMSGDEGESGFYRTTFNLQTLPTDECNWAWQTDADIPQLTGISWTSSSKRTAWTYQRLSFDILLYNFYLQQTAGRTDGDYAHYRAEVRFLRALHYWYFLDLFHKAPFKDETTAMAELPVEMQAKDLYTWLDKELTALESEMAPVGAHNNAKDFGRADAGAALLLHARLALGSELYTDGAVRDFKKAETLASQLIGSKYDLARQAKNGYSAYAQLFMADNDENPEAMQEIILPIRQDGVKTKSYSGANYLVSSTRISGMPYMGTSNGWSCNYARPDLVEKFFPNDDIPMAVDDGFASGNEADVIAHDAERGVSTKDVLAKAGDDRALFYAGYGGGIRKLRVEKMSNFLDGVSVVKFQNIRSDGAMTHDVEFPDMDIPLMRLAEAYLIRCEAKYRQGDMSGISDLNTLRLRAHAAPLTTMTERDIIDEWSREFYMEGRRRSDLNRFDMFAGKKYLWAWKGGNPAGQTVDSYYKYYPIPVDELRNNPNMKQNPGY